MIHGPRMSGRRSGGRQLGASSGFSASPQRHRAIMPYGTILARIGWTHKGIRDAGSAATNTVYMQPVVWRDEHRCDRDVDYACIRAANHDGRAKHREPLGMTSRP